MNTKLALVIVSLTLVAVIGGSLYFSVPAETISDSLNPSVPEGVEQVPTTTESIQSSIPRTLSTSSYGDLSGYKLVYNCTLEKQTDKASIITQTSLPITDEEAKEIASKVFGISNSKIEKEDDVYSIMLFGNKKEVDYFGLNGLLYYEAGLDTVVKDWDPDEMQEIAEKKLDALADYWTFDTEAKLRIDYIGPYGYSESTDLNGKLESREINSIGVFYTTSVNGIDIEGNGADFFFEIADGRVICAELRMPIVKTTGEQTVNVSPNDAVESFVNGYSASTDLGYKMMLGDLPKKGTCVIDSVKLVYVATYDHEKGNLPDMPLVYAIKGKLIYEDPESGSEVVQEFTDYQYATK